MIDHLRELERAATPGPWKTGAGGPLEPDDTGIWTADGQHEVLHAWHLPVGDNAALIAAMRNALPALIDVAKAARALNESAADYRVEAKARGVWDANDADCMIVQGILFKLTGPLTMLDNPFPVSQADPS